MRPGAKRRDHRRLALGENVERDFAGFNEARREAPGSRLWNPWTAATRGSRSSASMRPGAKRRDHFTAAARVSGGDCAAASMRPGAKRRDHTERAHTRMLYLRRCKRFNEARREAPGSHPGVR